MSFWSVSPGPTWTDVLKGFFQQTTPHLCKESLLSNTRPIKEPNGVRLVRCSKVDAEEISTLLKEHYQTFPRSRIFLPAQRIREGFLYDGWLACGVRAKNGRLVGICISRPLGSMRIGSFPIQETGLVDFFCVATEWRKKGIATFLLQELVQYTAEQCRNVHIFTKEGFPLLSLPPIWLSQYILREKEVVQSEKKGLLTRLDIGIRNMEKFEDIFKQLPLVPTIQNQPVWNSGDSEIFLYKEGDYSVFICITDTFHRSVPEAWRIGEILWVSADSDTPLEIQQNGVEALVDSSRYDVVLMDIAWPHSSDRNWKKDTIYGWYLFNCYPGTFFHLKPSWIL